MINPVADELPERIGEPTRVEQPDRLGVATDDPSNKCLEELFPCSKASGKNREPITALFELAFSLAHRVDDDEFIAASPALFESEKLFCDDAGDVGSGALCTSSDLAHQSDPAAAVDKVHAAVTDRFTEVLRSFEKDWVESARARAIDGDRWSLRRGGHALLR